ncbi:MAG TPA: tetratricopeptide repeat protein [Drouetiella sp.]|jgi:tetratricopeptide (TPR) repeat protein
MQRTLIWLSLIVLSIVSTTAVVAKKPPQSPGPFVQAANSFMQTNRYKDAVDNYSKAIKLDKNNPALYQQRANANIQMAKPKKAIGDLNKALSLDPNDANTYNLRARAYDALSNYEKEIEDLNDLIRRTPDNGVNLLWRAKINNQLKNPREVIADCDRAINLGLGRQDLADLYKLKSESYKKLGKKTEAKQELAKYNSLQQ